MSLLQQKLLFIDCQTTGMHPSMGSLLEIAWGWGCAPEDKLQSLHCELVQLPVGESIPSAIQALTGLVNSDLDSAKPLSELSLDFRESLKKEDQNHLAVIHYAQFEKAFLKDLFLKTTGSDSLPFEVLCSQALAKKLFPQLPSRNLRGLVGHFGSSLGELKRASSHVEATFQIWKGLVAELENRGLDTLPLIQQFLKKPLEKKTDAKSKRYQYKIDDKLRLALPPKPGIYRMLNKKNEILYIGKATSLRDRVNSYFRGKKGRDRRKLEMLTQVWELQFVETETVLQAALLESDEIKHHNPPYNISLKTGRRSLVFYSRDFEEHSLVQNKKCFLGPFRPNSPLEQLRLFVQSEKSGLTSPFFYQEIPFEVILEGFELFTEAHHLDRRDFANLRAALTVGCLLLRQQLKEKNQSLEIEEEVPDEDSSQFTAEQVAGKFERLFLRAAKEFHRSRMMTRLLNSHVEWESEIGWKSLDVRNGKIQSLESSLPQEPPWLNLNITDYDRMSILLSEIAKHPHRIQGFSLESLRKFHHELREENGAESFSEQNSQQPPIPDSSPPTTC